MLNLQNPRHIVKASQRVWDIICKLYPSYSIVYAPINDAFLLEMDIKSVKQRESLMSYDKYVVKSDYIFDFEVGEEELVQAILTFRKVNFGDQKRTLQIPQSCDPFDYLEEKLYDLSSVEDTEVFRMFDAVGSREFGRVFLELANKTPVPVLAKALETFLVKTEQGTASVYYKRMHAKLSGRISQRKFVALQGFSRLSNNQTDLALSVLNMHRLMFL